MNVRAGYVLHFENADEEIVWDEVDELSELFASRMTIKHKEGNRFENDPEAKTAMQEDLDTPDDFLFPHESFDEYDIDGYNPMDTAEYRRRYLKGKEAEYKYHDVGHILAASNGGADAAQNYHMEDKYMNRVVAKDRLDAFHAYKVGERRTEAAVRVSQMEDAPRRYPGKVYRQGSPSKIANELYHEGKEIAEGLGLKRTKNYDAWDQRTKAFRSGDAFLKKDGTLDGRCRLARRYSYDSDSD